MTWSLLSSLSGLPDLQFVKAMAAEHLDKAGSDVSFTTSNYGLTTTPRTEWAVVVDRQPCAPESIRHGRIIPDVDALMNVPLAVKAGLTRPEVIALVMYTGPMVSV